MTDKKKVPSELAALQQQVGELTEALQRERADVTNVRRRHEEQIANLKSIIHRFSEFSKMPQPQLREVSLLELISGVAHVYEAQFEKMHIVCRTESADLKPISADPELLHRAVSNLVLNAIDAMPRGGTLTAQPTSMPAAHASCFAWSSPLWASSRHAS